MKYKNWNLFVEDTRELVLDIKNYKKTFPKFFSFRVYKDFYEKSFFIKIGYYRLIISVDRYVLLRKAQWELNQIPEFYKKTGTEDNIVSINKN